MRVLFIQLYSGDEVEPIYPLGLCYLATALPTHETKIFDQNMCNDPFSETEKILSDFSPDVVGISIRNIRLHSKKKGYSLFQDQLKRTIRIIKQTNDKIIIIAGGAAFSMFPIRFMKDEPEIDFGIFLEGEESFSSLLENLESPEKIKGIYWRNKDEILFTGGYPLPNFQTLSAPRRDLIDPKRYKGMDAIGVQTKRGCLLKCSYCSYPFLSGNMLRLRPPEKVVDEIEHLVNSYGIREFTFVDNVFNIPLSHSERICQEIINRKIQVQWSAWFNERFMDESFIDLAIKAGCGVFELSPDGYSNHSLEWLNKNIQTKHIINTYRLLKKRPKVKVVYNFLIGIPGQNIPALLRQIVFFLKLKFQLRGQLKGIRLNSLWIEPKTVLEKLALEKGIISSETDLFNTTLYEVGIVRFIRRIKKLNSILKSIKKEMFYQ